MDIEELREKQAYALSNHDINELFDKLKIERPKISIYPEILEMRHIDEALNRQGKGILLYLVDNENSGHWTSILKKGNTIEMSDSYGNKIDTQDEKLGGKRENNRKWGQDTDALKKLIKDSGYKIKSNTQKNQKVSPNINTCGRHAITRLLFSHYTTKEYNDMLKDIKKEYGVDADALTTALTNDIIGK